MPKQEKNLPILYGKIICNKLLTKRLMGRIGLGPKEQISFPGLYLFH